ncbi:hypothetical protein COBT_002166 [Conglomerata obtusa]
MLNVLENIKKEGIFTFEILKNFYDLYIKKTIEINLNSEPTYINFINDKLATFDSIENSREEHSSQGNNSFDSNKYPNRNKKSLNLKNANDEKEIDIIGENTKLGEADNHYKIFESCIYHAIYAILYNCSLFKDQFDFHILLNELNFNIDKPNFSINNRYNMKSTEENSTINAINDCRYLNTNITIAMVNNGVPTYHICNYYYIKCKELHDFDNNEKYKIQNDIIKMFSDYFNSNKSMIDKHSNYVFITRLFILNCACSNMLDRICNEISDDVIFEYIYITIENYIKAYKDALPEYLMLKKENVFIAWKNKGRV